MGQPSTFTGPVSSSSAARPSGSTAITPSTLPMPVLRGEVHEHPGHGREAGRRGSCSGSSSRQELRVPRLVVGREPPACGFGERPHRVVPRRVTEQGADVELAVVRGDDPVAADEPARGTRLRVVLHDEEIPTITVAAEQRGRQRRGGRRRVPPRARARTSCVCTLSTASRTGSARLGSSRTLVEASERTRVSAAVPASSCGVTLATVFEREPTARPP